MIVVKSSVKSECFSGRGEREHLMADTGRDFRACGSSFTVPDFTFSELPVQHDVSTTGINKQYSYIMRQNVLDANL